MIKIYTSYGDAHGRLDRILQSELGTPYKIERTESGKPYIEGNPVFISLSHSGERAIIALSDKAVGVDLEVFKDKSRESVISRFSARERAEIACERDFLKHWTVREAFVKLHGLTIAKLWKRIEFFGGKVYLDGTLQSVKVRFYEFYYGVACVCFEE